MWKKLEEWLLTKFAGKLLARAAVTLAGFLASEPVAAALAKVGISITSQVDQEAFVAGLIALGHAAFEWFKNRKAKKEEPAPAQ